MIEEWNKIKKHSKKNNANQEKQNETHSDKSITFQGGFVNL